MTNYVKTYKQAIDGEHLTTHFEFDMHDLVYLQVFLEEFVHGSDEDPAPDELIRAARLLQLVERAYGDHVLAQNDRLDEQEGFYNDSED